MSKPVGLDEDGSQAAQETKPQGGVFEFIKVVVQALLIALVVRTFLFQPFNIPSGSMIPTLLVGDFLFVSKYSYGYSKFSFPLSPNLFQGRILATPPKQGDVVVFKLPRDNSTDYIKRVIGLPGDTVQMKQGRLYINGKEVPREPIKEYRTEDFYGRMADVPTYTETLPDGVKHTIIEIQGDQGFNDNTELFKVPPNNYFMMGDNRDNSTDSRVPPDQGGVGYVPFENLVGRAEIIFFSVKEGDFGLEGVGVAVDRALEPAVQADPLTSDRDLADLEARLGHAFRDRAILTTALTHIGAAASRPESYQRLEFLGDRVLGLAVAAMLYAAFPEADEGDLSRRLADLVRRESCAEVAADWGVEPHIRLAPGERASAALRRAILGDVCEAILGAVYLDGGLGTAGALVERAFAERMRAPRRLRDAKTTLQEWAQAKGLAIPLYREVARRGPQHAPEFTVAVALDGFAAAEAAGSSKRNAEQAAAAAFMAREAIAAPTEGRDA